MRNDINCCRDCAAPGKSEHHQQRHLQELHARSKAVQAVVAQEVAGDLHIVRVAGAAIEDQLGPDAGMTTAEDRG